MHKKSALLALFYLAMLGACTNQREPEPNDALAEWLQAALLPLETVEPYSSSDDLHILDDAIGDAKIVLMGEPTHGNREVFLLKHRFFKYLVEHKGFNVFALEAPMPEGFDINRFVLEGEGDPEKLLAGLTMWTWDTQEVLDVISWMRSHNATAADDKKVSFYAFDMQTSERAARITLAYLQDVDPGLWTEAKDQLGPLAIAFTDPDNLGWRPVFSGEPDAGAVAMAQRLLQSFDAQHDAYVSESSEEAWAFARQHAQILNYWVEANAEDGENYTEVRDRAMAKNLQWIMEREGADAKAFVWTHNSHIADATIARWGDVDTAGRHLRRAYGDELRIIGTLFGAGSFVALDPARGLQSYMIEKPLVNSVEDALFDADHALGVVDLQTLPSSGPVVAWTSSPQTTMHSGGGFDPSKRDRYTMNYLLPEAFDLLAWVKATGPVRTLFAKDYEPIPVSLSASDLDFEDGEGTSGTGWFVWPKQRRLGYEAGITTASPYNGNAAGFIRRQKQNPPGEASGSLIQRIDAAPWRGKKLRLSAYARHEIAPGEARAFLRLKIDETSPPGVHDLPLTLFDSFTEGTVTSADWREYAIEADVPETAGVILIGYFLHGRGEAFIDNVRIEAVEN